MLNLVELSKNGNDLLESIIQIKSYSKMNMIIEKGKANYKEYILKKGYCRSFLISPEGEEITLSFFKPNDVLSPHIIRTKENISLLNYQALTDTEFYEFDALSFLNLMIENIEIRNFGNNILKEELQKKTNKEIALASLTAKERLQLFRNEYAILENLIPHSMIASYLGITNISLSRLRSGLK